jgi:GDP-L-fucose synthase
MLNYNDSEIINLGTEEEITIKNLALLIKEISNFEGELKFNENYPDGVMRKVMDSSKIHNLGWKHKTPLKQGLVDLWSQLSDDVF